MATTSTTFNFGCTLILYKDWCQCKDAKADLILTEYFLIGIPDDKTKSTKVKKKYLLKDLLEYTVVRPSTLTAKTVEFKCVGTTIANLKEIAEFLKKRKIL